MAEERGEESPWKRNPLEAFMGDERAIKDGPFYAAPGGILLQMFRALEHLDPHTGRQRDVYRALFRATEDLFQTLADHYMPPGAGDYIVNWLHEQYDSKLNVMDNDPDAGPHKAGNPVENES